MKKWTDIIQEQVRREHRDKVLNAASQLLKENAAQNKESFGKRYFLKGLVGGLAAAAAAIFVVLRPAVRESDENKEIATSGNSIDGNFLAMQPMMQVDLDLLANLDMIEDLEVVERWEPDKT